MRLQQDADRPRHRGTDSMRTTIKKVLSVKLTECKICLAREQTSYVMRVCTLDHCSRHEINEKQHAQTNEHSLISVLSINSE